MARSKNQLTAIQVRNAPPGKLSDGYGLFLDKSDAGGKWIYRYSFGGRRREMGLGSSADVSLSDARKSRDKWAATLLAGADPITERERIRAEATAALNRTDPTVAELTALVFENRKATLRGDGTRGRWLSPLNTHILPKIGSMRVSDVHQSHIRNALHPIWRTKPETADKAIQRMRIIFRQAKLMGLPADPFTIDAAKHMLGDRPQRAVPITATPWQDIPALFAKLDRNAVSYQALRFIILTASRSEPARGARFSEISAGTWTVPADRMKGREGKVDDFRVPLSQAALEIVELSRSAATDDLIFPSYRVGQYISSSAIHTTLNTMGEPGRPHGFRTSFRTWVQDTQAAPFDVAETALAHQIGSKVERSYARSDLLDQRAILMEKWGAFVTGKAATVVSLRRSTM